VDQGLVLTRAGRGSGMLLCSYHPFTGKHAEGKLTEKMFLDVFRQAARLIKK
jgi:uracil-DNA glycosylase